MLLNCYMVMNNSTIQQFSNSTIFYLLFLFFFPTLAAGQIFQSDSAKSSLPKKPQIIITNDGGTFIGYIEAMDDREITIATKDKGRIIIPKYAVRSIETVTEDNYTFGKYVSENNFSGRYALASSALPAEKGKLYLTVLYAAGGADYAITDNFSMGINTTIIGLPFLLNSRASARISPKLFLGAEAGAGWLWVMPKSYFAYGAMKITQGTSNDNFTVSGGYLFADMQGMRGRFVTDLFFLNLTMLKRISPRFAFFAEGWGMGIQNRLFPLALTVAGVKTLKRKNSSWTFSLLTFIIQDRNSWSGSVETFIIPVPLIGWAGRI